jgi:N-formylglutamate amidohydrolase
LAARWPRSRNATATRCCGRRTRSAAGCSADVELIARLKRVAETEGAAAGYSHALDGRFKGGYITRSFGDPDRGVHAVQLELSQITYMDEAPPFGFRDDLAKGIRPVLRRFLETLLNWEGERYG